MGAECSVSNHQCDMRHAEHDKVHELLTNEVRFQRKILWGILVAILIEAAIVGWRAFTAPIAVAAGVG